METKKFLDLADKNKFLFGRYLFIFACAVMLVCFLLITALVFLTYHPSNKINNLMDDYTLLLFFIAGVIAALIGIFVSKYQYKKMRNKAMIAYLEDLSITTASDVVRNAKNYVRSLSAKDVDSDISHQRFFIESTENLIAIDEAIEQLRQKPS